MFDAPLVHIPLEAARVAELARSPAFGLLEKQVVAEDREAKAQQRRVARGAFDEYQEALDRDLAGLGVDLASANEALAEARVTFDECKRHRDKLGIERQGKTSYAAARRGPLLAAVRRAADPELIACRVWLRDEANRTRSEGRPVAWLAARTLLATVMGKRPDTLLDWSLVTRRAEAIREAMAAVDDALERPLSVAEVDELVERLKSNIPALF